MTLELGEPLKPYPFQQVDVDLLLARNLKGFVVAETGAGKSIIGIEAGRQSGLRVVLVIAPLSTQDHVWYEGIIRQDPGINVKVINGTPKGKEAMSDLELGYPGWYLVTPQLFTRWDFSGVRPALTIVDEAHLLGHRDTVGQKKLGKLKSPYKIMMSGTMWRNRVENAWGLLRATFPHLSGAGELADLSYNRWVRKYMATVYDHFAVGNIKIVGELEPGRLAEEISQAGGWVQHFKRAECCEFHPEGFLHDLPAPITIKHSVDLAPEQKKAIARMEEDYLAWLRTDTGEKKALVAKLPIVARTRLRQMTLALPSFRATGQYDENGMPKHEIWFEPDCISPKLDHFEGRLDDTVDQPYLALTSSEKFATEVSRRLNARGVPTEKWAGTVASKERDNIKARFQNGDTRVVIGVVEAVATGIDGLQFAASDLYHFDRSQDLTSEIQVEGRLDRRGQTNQVVNEEVLARGSMDEGIIGAQLRKRLDLNKSLQKKIKSDAWKARQAVADRG